MERGEIFLRVPSMYFFNPGKEGGKGIRNIIDIEFQEKRQRVKRILKNLMEKLFKKNI